MFTVIVEAKNKEGGTDVRVSTGFANRGEASRFATGLAKTGKIDKADIRETPDPSLLDTLIDWVNRIEKEDAGLPEDMRRHELLQELLEAIAVLEGGVGVVLRLAHKRMADVINASPIARAEGCCGVLDEIQGAIAALNAFFGEGGV